VYLYMPAERHSGENVIVDRQTHAHTDRHAHHSMGLLVMPLTVILIIVSFPSPAFSFIPENVRYDWQAGRHNI